MSLHLTPDMSGTGRGRRYTRPSTTCLGAEITFFIPGSLSPSLMLSRLIMSPWNLVSSFSLRPQPQKSCRLRTPPEAWGQGSRTLICSGESGQGHDQKPRKWREPPYALQRRKLRPRERTGTWSGIGPCRHPVRKEGADGGSGFLVTDKTDTWESGGSGWSLLWGTEPKVLAVTLEVASGMWPLFWGRGEGL